MSIGTPNRGPGGGWTPRGCESFESRSYKGIEAAAWSMRETLGLRPLDRVRAFDLLESLHLYGLWVDNQWVDGISLVPLNWRLSSEMPRGYPAYTCYDIGHRRCVEIVVSEETYFGAESALPHHRFTIAHEVGHAVLHTSELMDYAHRPEAALLAREGRGEASHPPYRDTEWQANAYAAALLAPAQGLEELRRCERLTPEALIQQFGISFQAARLRINQFLPRRRSLLSATRAPGAEPYSQATRCRDPHDPDEPYASGK